MIPRSRTIANAKSLTEVSLLWYVTSFSAQTLESCLNIKDSYFPNVTHLQLWQFEQEKKAFEDILRYFITDEFSITSYLAEMRITSLKPMLEYLWPKQNKLMYYCTIHTLTPWAPPQTPPHPRTFFFYPWLFFKCALFYTRSSLEFKQNGAIRRMETTWWWEIRGGGKHQ